MKIVQASLFVAGVGLIMCGMAANLFPSRDLFVDAPVVIFGFVLAMYASLSWSCDLKASDIRRLAKYGCILVLISVLADSVTAWLLMNIAGSEFEQNPIMRYFFTSPSMLSMVAVIAEQASLGLVLQAAPALLGLWCVRSDHQIRHDHRTVFFAFALVEVTWGAAFSRLYFGAVFNIVGTAMYTWSGLVIPMMLLLATTCIVLLVTLFMNIAFQPVSEPEHVR